MCVDHLHDLCSSPIDQGLTALFENPQPVPAQNFFDLLVAQIAGLTLLGPRLGEEPSRFSGLPYLLPRSWGTVTSTCSLEEFPPLSVQVIVTV